MTSRPGRKPDEDTDERRVYRNVAFVSSDYIPFFIGQLRVTGVDTSRMRTAGVPILRSHNGDAVIGRVTSVRKDNDLWRSDWEIPKLDGTRRSLDEMDAGINLGISVGANILWDTFQVDNEDPVDDLDDLRLSTEVLLIEESLTPIPADARAGINRSLGADLERDGSPYDTLLSPDGIFPVGDTRALRSRLEGLRRTHNEKIARKRAEVEMTTQQTIAPDVLERAISDALAKHEGVQRVGEMNTKLDALMASDEKREREMMDLGHKMNTIQFQPEGQVLQMSNWGVRDTPLSLGKILRLTCADDIGLPPLDRSESTLEESFLERLGLDPAGRSVVARLPFAAIEERERQMQLQRNTMASGAGARRLDIHILGDGGLLLNAFNPILGAMNMRSGLSGGQKQPYWTAQGSAAGGAEGSDIPISTWTLDNEELLPVSIATGFDISSSLRAADDMTFESLVYSSVQMVAGDELVKNVLIGGGSAENEISGLWSRVSTSTPDQAVAYGAAQTDFSRDDILSLMNLVDLAKTDGGPGVFVLSTTLYQLAQNTLRGGAASDRYLLETMDGMNMGMMEGRPAYHYRDLAVASVVDPAIYFKADRSTIFLWGNSFTLEEVPVMARKTQWKLCVEANLGVIQPNHNLARIAQG